ncbi:MAG: CoA pyrophosphatase [Sandaracinaceae bacterium]|jgi:8-oxo-dGTP pyrophosphatase MutT (NUDIX family)|nr:CoA pyrophosphatase [Sandaracinaceae bacterium]
MAHVETLEEIRARLLAAEKGSSLVHDDARAAVAAIFREKVPDIGPELLFIRRAEHPKDPWSGHMAFPGGRRDPDDADLLSTAVRETHEEIGINLRTQARLLGQLDELPAMARGERLGLTITPFVFELVTDQTLVLDETEVAEALWTPIRPMLRGESSTEFPYTYRNEPLRLPGYQVGERVVWGLTYQMLQVLFRSLASKP